LTAVGNLVLPVHGDQSELLARILESSCFEGAGRQVDVAELWRNGRSREGLTCGGDTWGTPAEFLWESVTGVFVAEKYGWGMTPEYLHEWKLLCRGALSIGNLEENHGASNLGDRRREKH